jgi:hypothetical protein
LSRLIEMMFESGTVAAIVFVGLAINVLAVIFAFMRHRAASQTATKLVDLALGGRADEARIQARNATREISPLLDVLGGELAPPKSRTPAREAILSLIVGSVPLILCIYAMSALTSNEENRADVAGAFLVGLAVLVPFSIAAGVSVIGLGRQTSRAIRGSSITLLARQVKTAVDAEVADALRRGNPVRDPRGE